MLHLIVKKIKEMQCVKDLRHAFASQIFRIRNGLERI